MAHFNLPRIKVFWFPENDIFQSPENSKFQSSETAIIVRMAYFSGNIISRKQNISISQKWDVSLKNLAISQKIYFEVNATSHVNFIEITLRHGCSPVNFLQIFRKTFLKNTSERLLLDFFNRDVVVFFEASVFKELRIYAFSHQKQCAMLHPFFNMNNPFLTCAPKIV